MLALDIAEERTEELPFWDLDPGASSPSITAANGPAYRASATYTYDHASGAILYEEFHPYGSSAYRAVDSTVEVSAKRYRYTGKERDEETGLDHMGARYYAGWLGRWTSADPIGLGDGVNRYAYVRGNPVGMRDPSGTLAGPPEQEQPKPILDTKRELSEAEQKKLSEMEVSFGNVEVRTDSGLPKSPRGIVAEAVHAKFSGYAKAEDFSLEAVRAELQDISEVGDIPSEGSVEVKLRGDEALRLAKRFEVSAGQTERLFPDLAPFIEGTGLIDAPGEVKAGAELIVVIGSVIDLNKARKGLIDLLKAKLAQRQAVKEAAKETAEEAGERVAAKEAAEATAAKAGDVKKLGDPFLKREGLDAERFKDAFVPGSGGRFNVSRDTATGELVLTPVKKGAEEAVRTGMTLEQAAAEYARRVPRRRPRGR